jgi:hypothetical protein
MKRTSCGLLVAVFAVLTAVPAWAAAATTPISDQVQLAEQDRRLCTEVIEAGAPGAPSEVEADLEKVLTPRPRPAWCPYNRPCPGGFCPYYPDCGEPACVNGFCQYW